ncbi:MAG: hypothetical protein HY678_01650, partial [Chloroflexi bacterium]|nr:hypothetical protein [Chloroflexota bacterium]
RYEIGQAITLTEADFTGIGQTFLNHSTGIVARVKHHLQRVSPED